MKALIYLPIIFILFSCSKKKEEFLSVPSIPQGYHLEVSNSWGNPTSFLPNEKVLKFDSLTKMVTISGSSQEFNPNGIYPYRFYDTTVYITDPRTWKPLPRYLHLLSIKNFPAQRLSVNERSKNKLIVTADYYLNIWDDEVEYHFVFK